MALNVGTIEAIIRLRDELTPTLKRVGDQLSSVGDDVRRAGTQIREAGSALSIGITAPLVAASAASLKFSSDFETAMTKIGNLTNIGISGIGEMRRQILELSPSVGRGPQELAEGLLVVASTGLKGADAMAVLTASARASAVGLGDTKDIARAVTASITAYGKENLSAAEAADKLFVAVREGGAEADEFADTLGRVVGIASQVGVSFDEVLASLATFTRLGVDADEAVTGLRGTLGTILSPSNDAREQLLALGTSIEELRKSVRERGLTEALVDLVALTRGNDDAISAIVPNVRALAAILGTAGSQAASYKESLDRIKSSTGELDKAFENVSETLGFKWNQVMAEARTLLIQFGDAIAPAFEDALPTIRGFVRALAEAVDWFSRLPGPVKAVALATAALGAALGPVLFIVGNLTTAVGSVISIFGTASASIARFAAAAATQRAALAALAADQARYTALAAAAQAATANWGASSIAAIAANQRLAAATTPLIAAQLRVATATTAAEAATAKWGATSIAAIAAQQRLAAASATLAATQTAAGVSTAAAGTAAVTASAGFAAFWRTSLTGTTILSGLTLGITGLRTALLGLWATLGPVALAIGAVWAAWKIGNTETVTTAIQRWTLAGKDQLAIATRWALGIKGMTDEQARATIEFEKSARAMKDNGAAMEEAAMKAKLAADQYAQLKQQLSGAIASQNVAELQRAMNDFNAAGELNVGTLKRIGEAAIQAAAAGGTLTPELKSVVDWINRERAATEAAAEAQQRAIATRQKQVEAAQEYAKKLDALRSALSGADVLRDAKMYERVIKDIGGATKLSHEEAKKAHEAFKAVADKFREMGPEGQKIAEHFDALAKSLRVGRSQMEIVGKLKPTGLEAWKTEAKDAAAAAEEMTLGLDRLRSKMTLVAQDQFGGLRAFSPSNEAFELIAQATKDLEEFEKKTDVGAALKAGLLGSLNDIPQIVIGGLAHGASALEIGSSLAASVGSSVGSMLGAAIAGPLGAAIGGALGSAAGAIVAPIADALNDSGGERSVRNVGRRFGVAITEELGNAINDTAKALFGGGRDAAAVFHLKDILEQAGGLDTSNVGTFTARLRDVFVEIETGMFTAAQGAKVLNENFGEFAAFFDDGLISKELQEIVMLTEQFGVESEAVTAFLKKQSETAIAGFQAIAASQLKAIDSQSGIDRLGRLAATSFDAALAAGVPFLEALKSAQGTFDAMNEAAEEFGLTQSVAFGDLSALSAFFAKNQELAGSIQGVEQMLRGLYNSNRLTQESFNDLATLAVENFNAMLGAGLTFDQAMMANRDTLQRLWEVVQDGRLVVDDTTRALLDQAESAGDIGDAHRDAQDRATRAMEQTAIAVNKLADVLAGAFDRSASAGEGFFGRIRTAISSLPKEVPIDITTRFTAPQSLPFGIDPSQFGGQLPGFATGTRGRFVDFGAGTPVMLHGRERVMTEGEGSTADPNLLRTLYRLDRRMNELPDDIQRAFAQALVLTGSV